MPMTRAREWTTGALDDAAILSHPSVKTLANTSHTLTISGTKMRTPLDDSNHAAVLTTETSFADAISTNALSLTRARVRAGSYHAVAASTEKILIAVTSSIFAVSISSTVEKALARSSTAI
jgi:hypothetical protein